MYIGIVRSFQKDGHEFERGDVYPVFDSDCDLLCVREDTWFEQDDPRIRVYDSDFIADVIKEDIYERT